MDVNLTVGNAIAAAVPLVGVFVGWLTWIQSTKEKHKVSVQADLDKEKSRIEASERNERLRIEADLEKEKHKSQAEVDKIRERGMGGEAVAKIWQAVDNMRGEIRDLETNQNKDHADGVLRSEIITKLTQEVTNITKLLFDNLINMRR